MANDTQPWQKAGPITIAKAGEIQTLVHMYVCRSHFDVKVRHKMLCLILLSACMFGLL